MKKECRLIYFLASAIRVLIQSCVVHAATLWTSGAVGSTAERKAARELRAAEEAGEIERLRTLKENATLPLLYLDVEVGWVPAACTETPCACRFAEMHNNVPKCLQISGEAVGRMLFVVFVDDAPIAAENFRQLFSGELVRLAGKQGLC